MKKNIFGTLAVAAVAALAMTSCNNSQPKVEPASAESKAPANLKIAYVEVDSIMTQYNFAKEYSALLEKKGQNIQKTLGAKGQQLQVAAANFQQKVQQNAYTRDQAEAIQSGLQRQQADLQGLQQRLGNEFQAEQNKYNKALHDSIANYLKEFNKDKKYSIIFSKSGDNLLYADKSYDITKDVVAGLNKAYKGKATEKK
nr:OmpH family outer membrane protein [Prevotella sp.]